MTWTPRTVVTGTRSFGVQGSCSAYLFDGQGTRHAVARVWTPDMPTTASTFLEYWEGRDGSSGTTTLTDDMSDTDPAGYVFDAEGTQHVVFLEADDTEHVGEIYWTDGEKTHDDLADHVSGFASADGRPMGYRFQPSFEASQHVVYRGLDNNVHELARERESWGTYDLTLSASGGRAVLGNPFGFAADLAGNQYVAVRATRSGEVDVLRWARDGGWSSTTVNTAPGTALAAGDVVGYSFESAGTQHVDYGDDHGHLWEIVHDSGWTPRNLTIAGLVPESANHAAGSGLAAWAAETGPHTPQPSRHLVWAGIDAHVHELRWTAAADWTWTDLTVVWGAPKVAITPVTATPSGFSDPATGTQHVFYVTEDHSLVELTWTPVSTRFGATQLGSGAVDVSQILRA